MVLRAKVEKTDTKTETIDEVISRGGHVLADLDAKKKKEWINFCLRIPVDMLDRIDQELEDRIGISKTGWILEAIQEKLKKQT